MYLVADIGGTKTRLAQSNDGKTLENVAVFPTPGTPDELAELIAREVKFTPTAVCVGVTRRRPDLAARLPHLFTCPVYVENDAALAGLAEATLGAGQAAGIVVFLTISTGVGGARIVDGRIEPSAFGFEPGRQLLWVADEVKSLEDLVSGRALAARYGKPAFEIDDVAVWQEAAQYLALGLHNTLVHWSPEVLVLGGQMVLGEPAIDLGEVERQLAPRLEFYHARPKIVRASLGDNSGLLGALIHCCEPK